MDSCENPRYSMPLAPPELITEIDQVEEFL